MELSEYCRTIETHLCRKNDGHLIRIAGPSFDVVAGWFARGVPLKVATAGIDRYFERYYRKGPRRRPVKIDFCDADVQDVFDEWRRATGVTSGEVAVIAGGVEAHTERRKGPSLPEHLERVLTRLSSLRATGALAGAADPVLDTVSAELDRARATSAGLRGEARRAVIDRLSQLDDDLLELAVSTAAMPLVDAAKAEAAESLAPFRATMAPDAYAAAMERAVGQALRTRLGLPVLRFS